MRRPWSELREAPDVVDNQFRYVPRLAALQLQAIVTLPVVPPRSMVSVTVPLMRSPDTLALPECCHAGVSMSKLTLLPLTVPFTTT